VFQLFLCAGADIDAENDAGRSALSYVAGYMVLNGFLDAHSREISRWSSASRIIDELELSSLTEVAVGRRQGNIARMLRTLSLPKLKLVEFDNTGSTPLCWSCKAGNLDGYNTLTLARYLGRFGVVQQLIERGVDPDFRDGQGRTGLHCAVSYDDDSIL